MQGINLNELDDKDLKKLIRKAELVIEKNNEKKNLDINAPDISEIADLIRKSSSKRGVNREVIINAVLRKMRVGQQISEDTQRREIKPKYRNPNKSDETWAGVGQKPRWMVNLLEQGYSLDSLLIKNQVEQHQHHQ